MDEELPQGKEEMDTTTTTIITTLGTLVVAVFGFVGKLVWDYRRETDNLRKRIDKYEDEVDGYKAIIEELKIRISILEHQDGEDEISWINQGGVYRYVSKGFVKYILTPLGVSQNEVLGKHYREVACFSTTVVHILEELDQVVASYGQGGVGNLVFHEFQRAPLIVVKRSLVGETGDVILKARAVFDFRHLEIEGENRGTV